MDIEKIRQCAQEVSNHLPTPWRAEYTEPSMSGNHFAMRGPGPGIRVTGYEYGWGRFVDYLNVCGPDVILALCDEIEKLRK